MLSITRMISHHGMVGTGKIALPAAGMADVGPGPCPPVPASRGQKPSVARISAPDRSDVCATPRMCARPASAQGDVRCARILQRLLALGREAHEDQQFVCRADFGVCKARTSKLSPPSNQGEKLLEHSRKPGDLLLHTATFRFGWKPRREHRSKRGIATLHSLAHLCIDSWRASIDGSRGESR